MANSTLRPGEDYEVGTRRKYRDPAVAEAYHREFAARPRSLSDLFVSMVSRAERKVIGAFLDRIRHEIVSIADIPCGTGKLLPIFAARELHAVTGDVSLEMIRIARGERDAGVALGFVGLDATNLPFARSAFDVVVCLRLLHRVPPEVKSSILRELHRVSSKYAIVSFGVTTPWHRLRLALRLLLTRRRTVPFPLSPAAATVLLREAGWTIVERRAVLPGLSSEEIVLLAR